MSPQGRLSQILDMARWAPSGDNAQPWRFEVRDERTFVLHGQDTRSHCLYDLDGRPTQLALGALIETAAIAASAHGLRLDARLRDLEDPSRPTFDVHLSPQADLAQDPLWRAIPVRSVHRRPLSRRSISAAHWQALKDAAGPDHELVAFEGKERLAWARLLWANGGLRLRLPEAFDTHRSVIEWGTRYSRTRIPDQALGVDPMTLVIMRHAMASWQRVDFMNRWLAGTHMPRLLMDFVPAVACGAHIALISRRPPTDVADHVAGGRAVQRFWLAATQMGLQHQPAATPLVFARYLRDGVTFTHSETELACAHALAARLDRLLDGRTDRTVWLGRIGFGAAAPARSVRLPLRDLLR